MWPKLPKNPLIATSLGIRINDTDTDICLSAKRFQGVKKITVCVITNRSQKHIMQSIKYQFTISFTSRILQYKYIAHSLDFEAKPLSTNNNNFAHQIEREYDSSHN